MGVIEDTGMSDRDKMEMMIEVSGIHNGWHDVFSQITIIFLKEFRIVPFKGFKVGFDNAVIFCFFGMTSLIDQTITLLFDYMLEE